MTATISGHTVEINYSPANGIKKSGYAWSCSCRVRGSEWFYVDVRELYAGEDHMEYADDVASSAAWLDSRDHYASAH